MELPPEKKPSLEDLFNSKRYDQPNLEFWENFQDEFRSKALTSVVKSNNSLKSAMKYSSCFVIFAMFAVLLLNTFNPDNFKLQDSIQNGEVYESDVSTNDSNHPSVFSQNESKSLSPSIYPTFTEFDEESFAEHNYHISSLQPNFHHRILDISPETLYNQTLNFSF